MAEKKTRRKKRTLPGAPDPISLRIPRSLLARIKAVAEKLGYSDAEVIRFATGIGLEHLKRIDFNIEGAIIDASNACLGKTEAPASGGERPGVAVGGRSSGSTKLPPRLGLNEDAPTRLTEDPRVSGPAS